MPYWKFFKESDVIDAISPGYPSPAEEIEGSRKFLLKWKLVPRIPKNLIKPHFLHSNEDEERFQFLKNALEAKDSRVIWCLRGGYGSNRLLPMMAKMKKPKEVKLLIGLSDVTSLQTFIIQEWGWPVFHSPILDRMGRGVVPPRDEKELHRIFFGQQTEVEFKKLKPLNDAAKKVRNLKSKIVGGNLTTLQSSMGTPWQINADNKLLFLEDWGERGYRIDRMLEQFRQGGVLKKCHGILLGDFLGGAEPATGKNNFNKVFKRWADDLDIPVFSGMQAGHGTIQRPIPFNTPCVLNVEAGRGHLIIQTGGRP
ncbi:S66 peptidase family protein [Bdellovibrio sp. HCB2-146]|uniref:S66 peptidase family protein n=1 Tax=Bdellovibrio sp. HCB2-146 TaxID=3394362 RepID=UPI0039BCBAE5